MDIVNSFHSKSYSPVAVCDSVSLAFTKTVSSEGVVVSGRVTKQGKEAGTVNYYGKNDSLVISLRPSAVLELPEQTAVLGSVPGYINEILIE